MRRNEGKYDQNSDRYLLGRLLSLLVDAVEDILFIRYDKNKVMIRTRAESLEDITIYRLCQGKPEQPAGYHFGKRNVEWSHYRENDRRGNL